MKKATLFVCLSLLLMVVFASQGMFDSAGEDISEETTSSNDEADVEVGEGFIGIGEGFNGEVEVEVDVSEGEIVKIEVLSHNETSGIADDALEQVPANIKEAQSTDVDVASGATATSEAIIEAVDNALDEAN
ncbi:FMN-binding protein [Natroniella sulfidigena]|uniref:FMN-binding protein n=1 Tax=Natroniella sulfidigena TaxID=723921 RepID=UPI00200AA663|nr:FMN-binding protein [Natroniella sulfidigena]MCK8818209.1 FMN-binding protein [Natroniella sulfidigena]